MVGLTRVELVTSSLSGTRSNQLSYKPGGFRKGGGTLSGRLRGFQLKPVLKAGLARPTDRPSP